jgi:hypothetical protein
MRELRVDAHLAEIVSRHFYPCRAGEAQRIKRCDGGRNRTCWQAGGSRLSQNGFWQVEPKFAAKPVAGRSFRGQLA